MNCIVYELYINKPFFRKEQKLHKNIFWLKKAKRFSVRKFALQNAIGISSDWK